MSEAWDRALRAAGDAGVEIRLLTTLAEADECVAIMKATWGDHQLVPRELIRAFEASENLLQGAYRDEHPVGFALGFYGRDPDGFHLHSHMLAVMPDDRGSGVGFSLKLAQRAATLDAGVTRIRWTFDPLQGRNAHFNLAKLAAVADGFHRDFYGEMDDILNAGDRTDRLVVRWDLDDERAPLGAGEGFEVLGFEKEGDAPAPGSVRHPEGSPALVRIPRDHAGMRVSDPGLAAAWREASAEAFEACFGAGLEAAGFADSAYVFA